MEIRESRMRRVCFATVLIAGGLLGADGLLGGGGLPDGPVAVIGAASAQPAAQAQPAQAQPAQAPPAQTPPAASKPAVARPAAATPSAAKPLGVKGEAGFVSLFDGKTLTGWTLVGGRGEGYGAKDGILFCAKGGGGKLLTEKEYADFVFRFEFRMPPEGSNNGLGIRAPLEGDAAYQGIELQILDEKAALAGKWGTLKDSQYHGSVYDVIAAKRGAQKPAGEWNAQEVTVKGRQITVRLNGQVILDANLDTVTDAETLKRHPGLARTSGHIGFLGHNDYLEFRRIRIKPL